MAEKRLNVGQQKSVIFTGKADRHPCGARASGAALVCGGVRLIADDGGPPPPDHDITRWYREAMDHYRSVGSLRKALEQIGRAHV